MARKRKNNIDLIYAAEAKEEILIAVPVDTH